jgi:hypothetical protein
VGFNTIGTMPEPDAEDRATIVPLVAKGRDPEPDPVRSGTEDGERLEVGDRVEVRDRFVGTWSRGFAVREVTDAGYLVDRVADASPLRAAIAFDAVRKERRRRSNWWY